MLLNGVSIRDEEVDGFGASYGDITPLLNVSLGSTVDFLVGYGDNNNFYNDCTSLSAQVETVTPTVQNHLVFTRQPANGDVNAPINVQVKAVDPQGHVLTNEPLGVSLHPNLSGSEVANDNDTYAPFVKGVATFTGKNAVFLDDAGTYTLIAFAGQNMGASDPDISNFVISTSFTIRFPHLIFTQQPKTALVDGPLSFGVELVNSKNKPVFAAGLSDDADEALVIGVDSITDGDSDSVHDNLNLVGSKYENLTPPSPNTPITVDTPDSYQLAITAYDPSTDGSITAPVISKTFRVLGMHLAFKQQPKTALVNTPIPMIVILVDGHNKPVPLSPLVGDFLTFALKEVSATGALSNVDPDIEDFDFGVFNNLSAPIGLRVDSPGKYQFLVTMDGGDSQAIPDIGTALSKVFTIK